MYMPSLSVQNPAAFLVWAPGANNPAAGYAEYMHYYPEHGIGVLIMDVRKWWCNPGYPMNIEKMPDSLCRGLAEFFLIAADMISAKEYLKKYIRIFRSMQWEILMGAVCRTRSRF